jgi:hypothetical protein
MSGVAATSVPRAARRRRVGRATFVVLVTAAAMTTGLLSSRGPANGAVVAVGLALVGGAAALKLTATDAPIERHPIDQVGWFVATAFVLSDACADISGSDAFATWTPGKWGSRWLHSCLLQESAMPCVGGRIATRGSATPTPISAGSRRSRCDVFVTRSLFCERPDAVLPASEIITSAGLCT